MSATQTAETTGAVHAPGNGKARAAPSGKKRKHTKKASSAKPAATKAAATPAAKPAAKAAAQTTPAKPPAIPAARPMTGPRSFPLADSLFQMLPNPGSPWTLDEGVAWLQAAAAAMRLAYKFPSIPAVTA